MVVKSKFFLIFFVLALGVSACTSSSDDGALDDALATLDAAEGERDTAVAALEEATAALEEAMALLATVPPTPASTTAAPTTTPPTTTVTVMPACSSDGLPSDVGGEPSDGVSGDINGDGIDDHVWTVQGSTTEQWYLIASMGGESLEYHVLTQGSPGAINEQGNSVSGTHNLDGDGDIELWVTVGGVRHASAPKLVVFEDCSLQETGFSLRTEDEYQPVPPFTRSFCQVMDGVTTYAQIVVSLASGGGESGPWLVNVSTLRLEGTAMVSASDVVAVPDEKEVTGNYESGFAWAADRGFAATTC